MDEVFLNAPDEYEATCFKTKGLLRWALDHGYSHVFKTDIDTLVNPVNLMNSGFEQHDFVGAAEQRLPQHLLVFRNHQRLSFSGEAGHF